MPGESDNSLGNILFQSMFAVGGPSGITTPSVNANTSTTATYTVSGLQTGDLIDLQSQSHVAGLSVASAWCATNGTITIQFINSTTGTISAQTNYIVIGSLSRANRASPSQLASGWT